MTSPSFKTPLLDQVQIPADLKRFSRAQLGSLCQEIRDEMIHVVSKTGGHLGAGLGVVELTVALHRVFEAPKDKLIWDVSHQTYPHKILTGRRDQMSTLRQPGGLSGFAKRSESEYDAFGAGHSSTSISAALGVAAARDLRREGDIGHVVAIIGDGAMSAGQAFEALNNAGALKTHLIIVLNDNDMSIAPPTGAMADHFRTLSPDISQNSGYFEALGCSYQGPIDGHDVETLIAHLEGAKTLKSGPVLVHVKTQKGKGFAPFSQRPDKGHATGKFDVVSGESTETKSNIPSYTSVFASSLINAAKNDPDIVAITAAMPDGTGLHEFEKVFPERFFDVGIAEQHAVTFAAGLAASGMKPFCAIYSTFLQRGYDQIIHDVAIQNLPVKFAIDRAGAVGADGATHAGLFDLSFLANLPNFIVMAPSDEGELAHMVHTAAHYNEGPIAFRYPRGEGQGVALPDCPEMLAIGKGRMIAKGTDVAIVSLGTRLEKCRQARDLLAKQGISCSLADARFAKPIDFDMIRDLSKQHSALLVLEEGARGGFGSQVLQFVAEQGFVQAGLKVKSLHFPDQFVEYAGKEEERISALSVTRICQCVEELLST